MSELFRWYLGGLMATAREFCVAVRPERSTATSASSRAAGRRPASAGPSTTARSASASSATARACASRAGSRAPTPTATTPSRPRSPAACTASSTRSSRRRRTPATATRPPISPRIPWTFSRRSSCGATARSPSECFGDDVHHHVLNHAEAEWLAFNQTVTDWERRPLLRDGSDRRDAPTARCCVRSRSGSTFEETVERLATAIRLGVVEHG